MSTPFQTPPGSYGFPLAGPGLTPPAPQGGGRGGLIIVIAVLGVSLFVALCALVLFVAFGLSGEGSYEAAPTDLSSEYELTGTLPQAVAGQPYPAEKVQDVVERTLYEDYSTYYGIECQPIDAVSVLAATTCEGDIDGERTHITLNLDDEAGHFTMVQKW